MDMNKDSYVEFNLMQTIQIQYMHLFIDAKFVFSTQKSWAM